jgi:hypothetical protein
MMTIVMKSAAAVLAAAGLAYTSAGDAPPAYGDEGLKALTEEALADHAANVFQRSDRNQDGALNTDEYAALAIVSAELARLNGFIVIEGATGPARVTLAGYAPASLSAAEHARIDAVARSAFYLHAGDDGSMSEEEFTNAQQGVFDAADFNRNGVLRRGELEVFAQRQAMMSAGV